MSFQYFHLNSFCICLYSYLITLTQKVIFEAKLLYQLELHVDSSSLSPFCTLWSRLKATFKLKFVIISILSWKQLLVRSFSKPQPAILKCFQSLENVFFHPVINFCQMNYLPNVCPTCPRPSTRSHYDFGFLNDRS